ncbi:hypothetical protein VTJ49DRAFT_2874 [Mycothermus thermophilus]|uniref:3-phytase n=1 Tax=Humicola insolens TaxID=85995 RepID=A0ABR3V9E4_HUMIN
MSDSFSQWFRSFASCCGARQKQSKKQGDKVGDRNIVVIRDHQTVPRGPVRNVDEVLEKPPQKLRRPASRDSAARAWFGRSSSSVRRLQISQPTNFRHVQSESFQLPPHQSPPRPAPPQPTRSRRRSFRPIELSIYQPHNRLSAIMPHLENAITEPPPAHLAEKRTEFGARERTNSAMSFHLPRNHSRHGSTVSESTPPKIPPKSRARAHTAPSTERIVERIASAILEKERLQAEINRVIERQSIYLSRPSTGYDMQFEPMPSIPAVPAAAPSFAERLGTERPRTAPSRSRSAPEPDTIQELPELANTEVQPRTFTSPHVIYASPVSYAPPHVSPSATNLELPLAPPLPLVLRPPLRKKKSFSRVSSWLFHPDETVSSSHLSMTATAVTTSPRPIKEADGFYQCLAPPEGLPRTSMDTSSSVYTWGTHETDEDADTESKTVPTTTAWSPEQTPKQGSRHTTPSIGADKTGLEKEVAVGQVSVPAAEPEVAGLAVAEPMGHRPHGHVSAGSVTARQGLVPESYLQRRRPAQFVVDSDACSHWSPTVRSSSSVTVRSRCRASTSTSSETDAVQRNCVGGQEERDLQVHRLRRFALRFKMDSIRDWYGSRGRYTPLPSGPTGEDVNTPSQPEGLRRRIRAALIALSLVLMGVVGVAFMRPHHSCDTLDHGFQCAAEMSHSWGQYSPYFSVPSSIDPAIPQGCNVTFAQVLSRHGARAPTTGRAISYAAMIARIQRDATSYAPALRFLRTYRYALGTNGLTPMGERQMAYSGAKFYRRYRHLAREEVPFVRAGGIERVVVSAQNFTQGFHAARISDREAKGPTPELPWDMVVIPEDATANNTLHHGLCTAFEEGPYSGLGSAAQKEYLDEFALPIVERLNEQLPGANLSAVDVVALMDLCPFETVATPGGATISPFCRLFTPAEWRFYDRYQDVGKWFGYGPGNPLGPTQGVGFVNELIARLTGKPVRDGTSTNSTLNGDPETFPLGRRLYADFSHDNDMVSMLSALGLWEGVVAPGNGTLGEDGEQEDEGRFSTARSVPFAARVYVEKMRCEGPEEEEEMVRVLVNDRVMPLQQCGADERGLCTLSRFVKSLAFARGNGRWDLCFDETEDTTESG